MLSILFNAMHFISEQELARIRTIVTLDISFNNIQEISDSFGNLDLLQSLLLTGNAIRSISTKLITLQSLKVLKVRNY
jgi:Leucine-rich repeat (LRR) protein